MQKSVISILGLEKSTGNCKLHARHGWKNSITKLEKGGDAK